MGSRGWRWHMRWAVFLAPLLLIAAAMAPTGATAAPRGTPSPAGVAPAACTTPAVIFTHVPAYGSSEDLEGRVECLDPGAHRIALYIDVFGRWWNKPYWDQPTVEIAPDGTWSADITTGGYDSLATQIAAFAVPATYEVPELHGGGVLPQEVYDAAAAYFVIAREAAERTIAFSGYTWQVKESELPVGPGDNYFSSREEDVFVDDSGYLHLRIVQHDGRWYSSEVICQAPLLYGRYVFTVRSAIDDLDPNVVLGMFTWDTLAEEHAHREIDIEMSRWGEAGAPNAQYVVQPWDTPGNRHRFDLSLPSASSVSTHGFGWYPGEVYWQSVAGAVAFPVPDDRVLHAWEYTGEGVPPANGAGNARINLWLLNGQAPLDGQPVEVVVQSFRFIPGTSRAGERPAALLPLFIRS